METSEDEEARRKEAERAAKKAKKGFSEAELNQIIDVELKETTTITFMFIPGTVVNTETAEVEVVTADNKNYEALKQSKIGSDSYTARGTQTLNLTQKHKNESFLGFTQESKEVTASNWDIDDASK